MVSICKTKVVVIQCVLKNAFEINFENSKTPRFNYQLRKTNPQHWFVLSKFQKLFLNNIYLPSKMFFLRFRILFFFVKVWEVPNNLFNDQKWPQNIYFLFRFLSLEWNRWSIIMRNLQRSCHLKKNDYINTYLYMSAVCLHFLCSLMRKSIHSGPNHLLHWMQISIKT